MTYVPGLCHTALNDDIGVVGRKYDEENPAIGKRFFKEKDSGLIHRFRKHESSRLQERGAERPSALGSTNNGRHRPAFRAISARNRARNPVQQLRMMKTSPDTSVVHSISTRGRQP